MFKLKLTLLFVFALIILLSPVNSLAGTGKQKVKKSVEKLDIPFTIEVDEESSKKGQIVKLAIGKSTKFKCPEEPLQLIKGIPEAFNKEQDKPGRSDIEFYLTPVMPGIRTNIIVEMKSVSVDIQLEVVDIKGGAKVGQYNGEVLIKISPTKVAERVAKENNELNRVKEDLAKMEKQQQELQQQLSEKDANGAKQELEMLSLLEASWTVDSKLFTDTPKGLRIKQLGTMKRKDKGWVAVFVVENRGKESLSLDFQLDGAKVRSSQSSRQISPKQEIRVAVIIEPDSNNLTPSQLGFLINGSLTNIKLRS